mmetsp:Transcript_5445/g.8931  ORF Transcript_5445/g.8931 Transcript_5445/m.8931 type:complete len:207 (+) Transcript_5445:316-936(+)
MVTSHIPVRIPLRIHITTTGTCTCTRAGVCIGVLFQAFACGLRRRAWNAATSSSGLSTSTCSITGTGTGTFFCCHPLLLLLLYWLLLHTLCASIDVGSTTRTRSTGNVTGGGGDGSSVDRMIAAAATCTTCTGSDTIHFTSETSAFFQRMAVLLFTFKGSRFTKNNISLVSSRQGHNVLTRDFISISMDSNKHLEYVLVVKLEGLF